MKTCACCGKRYWFVPRGTIYSKEFDLYFYNCSCKSTITFKKTNKIKMLLLISLVLVGCGINNGSYHQGIDPEFREFYDQFILDSPKYGGPILNGIEIPVNFHDIPEEGRCRSSVGEVLINRDAWEKKTYEGKKALIYHELGHCLLGRDHNSNSVQIPGFIMKESLMNPSAPSGLLFSMFEDAYLTELFSGSSIWDEY